MTTSALVFATSRRTESDHRALRVGSDNCSSPPTREGFVERWILSMSLTAPARQTFRPNTLIERAIFLLSLIPEKGSARSGGGWEGPARSSYLAASRPFGVLVGAHDGGNRASPRTMPSLQRNAANQMDALALSANTMQSDGHAVCRARQGVEGPAVMR